jgi:hypothetical protein
VGVLATILWSGAAFVIVAAFWQSRRPASTIDRAFSDMTEKFEDLRLAWEDPVLEHFREYVLGREPATQRLVLTAFLPVCWILTGCLFWLFGRSLAAPFTLMVSPAIPAALMSIWLYFRRPGGRQRLSFLSDFRAEEWRFFPLEPLRAARLTAMRLLLDRRGWSWLRDGVLPTFVCTSIFIFMNRLSPAIRGQHLPVLFPAALLLNWGWCWVLLRGVGRMLPSVEAIFLVQALERLAARLPIPPLSQNPAATKNQKALLYGEFSRDMGIKWGLGDTTSGKLNMVGEHVDPRDFSIALETYGSLIRIWQDHGLDEGKNPPLTPAQKERFREKAPR